MRSFVVVLACSLAMLAACGDNLAGPGTIGGTVTGLEGSGLVLLDNGGDALQIDSDGAFTFATPIAAGATYAVSVGTQPSSPTQTCTVSNGQGVVNGAAITNITVTCQTGAFTVGGTVTGLAGTGLVLQNNGGDDLAVNGDGTFTFTTPLASGASFAVTALAQPSAPTQTCTVTNGTGSVTTAPVTSVKVTCSTDAFTVGGMVTGLEGTGLVLRNNGGDDLPIGANGTFVFATPVASGATYAVTVSSSPLSPSQTCTVTAGTGTVGGLPVKTVEVACTTNAYTIGGKVNGLVGNGLVLRNNGADDLPIAADGDFTFAIPVPSGKTFDVTVFSQPAGTVQTCTVGGGTGIVGGGDVASVVINCATNTYLVGGKVTGLEGTGLVVQNNGTDDAPIATTDGTFAFATPIASGSDYEVTVLDQPLTPAQTCTVTAGTGTVVGADISTVQIDCTTNKYPIAGTLNGLAPGETVVLRNNGEDLPRTGDGPFSFPTPVASGQTFNVTVSSQPDAPISQTCTVTDGSGTVGNTASSSANVVVTCTTNSFTIGGTVTGSGQPITLRNNGGDDLPVTVNGSFTFTTSVPSGEPYAVTIASAPGQQCTVTNGSGTVGAADVTDVIVSCVLGPFTTSGLPVDLPDSTWNPFGAFTFDGAGNLLAVTGDGPNKLYTVSRATDAVTSVDLPLPGPLVSIAYRAADNTVFFGSGYNGSIYSWNLTTATGGPVTTIPSLYATNGLAFAPATAGAIAGQLCAATYALTGDGKVICVDLATNAQTTIATVGVASAIAFSQAGDAYIADQSNGLIMRVSPGQAPVEFATGVGGPDGLAIDEGRARLYVADSTNANLYYIPFASGSPVAFPSTFAFDVGSYPSPLAFDGFNTLLYAVTPGSPTTVRAITIP